MRETWAWFRPPVPRTARGHRDRGRDGVSKGKTLVLLTVLTFIVLCVVGYQFNNKQGDAAGTNTGTISDYQTAQGNTGSDVQISQVGINQLANETGHLRV